MSYGPIIVLFDEPDTYESIYDFLTIRLKIDGTDQYFDVK